MDPVKKIGIVGGTGYVSGELLRLLVGHPDLELGCIASTSSPGMSVADAFPNLAGCYPDIQLAPMSELEADWREGCLSGIFCAAPHGSAAAVIDRLLAGDDVSPGRIVDISADFRFRDPETFAGIYGQPHGAPGLAGKFTCAVPEHLAEVATPHAAQPGCFATAMLLGLVPLLHSGFIDRQCFVSGVTGSTGSGRSPSATTHHPERHSNLFAYKPLAHRHAPEVEAIAEAVTGCRPEVRFVPHSGPFTRGIHVTIQGRLREGANPDDLRGALADTYRDHVFVELTAAPPRIKDVVGSNRARLHVSADEGSYVVLVVIDNLVKGAAGGAMQWMNRLLGIPEETGLTAPGPAWI
jgi:N-acetyl-gamma-glutamyl-phosphate reductase common form